MNDFYQLVRAEPSLNQIPVLLDGAKLGLELYSYFGTVHAYGSKGPVQISGTTNIYITSFSGSYPKFNWPASQFVMTEIGYHTSNGTELPCGMAPVIS